MWQRPLAVCTDTSLVGIGLAVVSLIVMPLLACAKQRTAREMRSRALEADARETWVCTYLSVALLIGLGLYAWLGWWWADPVGALLMEPVILWQAWDTLQEARECLRTDPRGHPRRLRVHRQLPIE